MIRPNTRLISLTSPHNPAGTVIGSDEMGAIIALCEARGCRLLLDETHRALGAEPARPDAA
ncbi:MAG: aminotransferase class I/II-fold pyridoxal phosphate-dependent enzyme, partial [Thermomicrobiales bacterium]